MTIEATTALLNQLFAMAQQDPDGRVSFGDSERVAKYLATLPGAHVSTFYSRDYASRKIVTDVGYPATSRLMILARYERPATPTEVETCEPKMAPHESVRNLNFYMVPPAVPPLIEAAPQSSSL
jgi:hypothetical protein